MDMLIIAEKPSVAGRIAASLGNGSEKKEYKNKIGFYKINKENGVIYVAAAVGHLFTIKQKGNERGYPVLDIEWAPSYVASSKYSYTKDYLDLIKELSSVSNVIVNACDFDIEGTVIGTNIIRFINSESKEKILNAKRMKFSTTTTPDLIESFEHLMPLDMNNFYAGEARHMLDWLWGINLSRALTYAVHGNNMTSMLSIGRVQGPTLAILAEREKEIEKFISKPFWRILIATKDVEFINTKGDIFDKQKAEQCYNNTLENKDKAFVKSIDRKETKINPYPPFDLTSLQLEASRVFQMDPSTTLSIAQSLYEHAYISYPRTSSQKLPSTLGLPKIIAALGKNPKYQDITDLLIKNKRFKPYEGNKSDEAHPAIFPTGLVPKGLNEYEEKLYDLVVKRFLACFAESASVARTKVVVSVGDEDYTASGSTILSPGWLEIYHYARIDEKVLPELELNEHVEISKVNINELKTQPPKRYTKAGLLSELEKRNLGTKATRAQIIDTLFKRKYIEGTSIIVTKFGMSVYEALASNCSMIVDEKTTRKLEEDTDKISKGLIKEEAVIDEGKKMLLEALEQFNKNREQLAAAMRKGLHESSVIGKCPVDGGDLVIRRSKAGKQFVACNNYPKCTKTYSIPQNALVLPTGKVCEKCANAPIVKIIVKKRKPFEMCLDPNCRAEIAEEKVQINKKIKKVNEEKNEEVNIEKEIKENTDIVNVAKETNTSNSSKTSKEKTKKKKTNSSKTQAKTKTQKKNKEHKKSEI
ncbi:MAG: DNA topoisomerase I [Candidatus Micrarchaeia archaeon]